MAAITRALSGKRRTAPQHDLLLLRNCANVALLREFTSRWRWWLRGHIATTRAACLRTLIIHELALILVDLAILFVPVNAVVVGKGEFHNLPGDEIRANTHINLDCRTQFIHMVLFHNASSKISVKDDVRVVERLDVIKENPGPNLTRSRTYQALPLCILDPDKSTRLHKLRHLAMGNDSPAVDVEVQAKINTGRRLKEPHLRP